MQPQTAANIGIDLEIREVKVLSTERNQTVLNRKEQQKVQHTAKMQSNKGLWVAFEWMQGLFHQN